MAQIQPITRIGPYCVGETPRTLIVTIANENGSFLDITAWTPSFEIVPVGFTQAGLEQGVASLVTDGSDGKVQYAWDAQDFQTAGLYRGQFWVTNGTLKYCSVLFEWIVYNDTESA